MTIALIGSGAIATFVRAHLAAKNIDVAATIVRKGKEDSAKRYVSSVADLPLGVTIMVDCAGHQALRTHGVLALQSGINVVTLSIGALADKTISTALNEAALSGRATLRLASGAIGALDALRAACCGHLSSVTYKGRKPPKGWIGSPAESVLDLGEISGAQTHFKGSAREAALTYPKNANVAAAVALSGIGFDNTIVELIADPNITANIHEIEATGEFGRLSFQIEGNSLPDNPKTSALAAMSVVASILEEQRPIRF